MTSEDGYVHVARIPAGAAYIELREYSKNHIGAYLVLRLLPYTCGNNNGIHRHLVEQVHRRSVKSS